MQRHLQQSSGRLCGSGRRNTDYWCRTAFDSCGKFTMRHNYKGTYSRVLAVFLGLAVGTLITDAVLHLIRAVSLSCDPYKGTCSKVLAVFVGLAVGTLITDDVLLLISVIKNARLNIIRDMLSTDLIQIVTCNLKLDFS